MNLASAHHKALSLFQANLDPLSPNLSSSEHGSSNQRERSDARPSGRSVRCVRTALQCVGSILGVLLINIAYGQATSNGIFHWKVGPPLLAVNQDRLPPSLEHPWLAVKDPSVVRFDGRWHLFCTLRKAKQGEGRIRIGYLSFADWSDANNADWTVLDLTMGYHGAPQIFYFEPHQKWYLVYQAEDTTRQLKYGPCFSTNDDLADPHGWTLPEPLYVVKQGAKAGLDFWIICDDTKAHLFFTSLNGQMWRAATLIDQFPNKGWTEPKVALQADIFEASHTYALRGQDKFLTIVEAQAGKRRYFKGFVADTLDGTWTPLAASQDKPLVSPNNVVNQSQSWATSYSHGEFVRAGVNQKLEIDPDNLELLFQGASDEEYQSGDYGQIPWRLGTLKLNSPAHTK
ncbi:non-reducing end alpha-L-arabinofuranosidase family hydrolase [Novipirellula artificiosorum]|uniref:non-reducing end alpha-L-arabinofuranosidase n=1 Tax=Novipirellula artificiosorum TaxID=2528016 RepID=A0A5C6DU51_9BACT|nr:non-reducing end alpha-L-arabinofuranosidase family hydrolase [Novipirellula artificiosorum]TWU38309.1 Alpha-L-arabinofuranosidase C precursor [Novipirellula artificiosorum]